MFFFKSELGQVGMLSSKPKIREMDQSVVRVVTQSGRYRCSSLKVSKPQTRSIFEIAYVPMLNQTGTLALSYDSGQRYSDRKLKHRTCRLLFRITWSAWALVYLAQTIIVVPSVGRNSEGLLGVALKLCRQLTIWPRVTG
jgi:hypothetical protein